MQNKKFIPTPLSDPSDRPPVQIVEPRPPSRLQVFIKLNFIASLLWRKLAVRVRPRLGHDGERYDALHNARYIRMFCEHMGGLWVKVGQILAMRRDVFSQTFCDELARLHDHASGFPGEIARGIVEQELGGPLEHYFLDFSLAPLAAASIAQTHEAHLKSGVHVAVKVQRPDAAAAFRRDLRFLQRIVGIIKFIGVLKSGRWDEMLWELDKTFSEELDYRLEASSISRMRKMLRKQKVYAPKVFLEHCTRRVLVMEFIEGVFVSEYIKVAQNDPARIRAWNLANNVSPTRLGKKLYLSHLRQVFEDNLYHCDLHPGNVVILRDNRFALIDFGSIGTFEKTFLEKYLIMFRAIAVRDFTKVVDIMLMTSPALPNIDLSDLRAELIRSMRAWELKTTIKGAPYHEKSLTTAMATLAEVLGKYEVPPAWEYLRLQRAEITLDSALSLLLPTVNYVKLAKSYTDKAQRRALQRRSTKGAGLQLLSAIGAIASLPQRLSENLNFDAEWIRKRAMNFGGALTTAAAVGELVLSFLIQLAVVGGVILFAAHVYPQFRHESALIDAVAANDTAATVIAWSRGTKLFVAFALFATVVLFVRIRKRVVTRRAYNPGAGRL
jgi:ubiquinone biosynthesis protein